MDYSKLTSTISFLGVRRVGEEKSDFPHDTAEIGI